MEQVKFDIEYDREEVNNLSDIKFPPPMFYNDLAFNQTLYSLYICYGYFFLEDENYFLGSIVSERNKSLIPEYSNDIKNISFLDNNKKSISCNGKSIDDHFTLCAGIYRTSLPLTEEDETGIIVLCMIDIRNKNFIISSHDGTEEIVDYHDVCIASRSEDDPNIFNLISFEELCPFLNNFDFNAIISHLEDSLYLQDEMNKAFDIYVDYLSSGKAPNLECQIILQLSDGNFIITPAIIGYLTFKETPLRKILGMKREEIKFKNISIGQMSKIMHYMIINKLPNLYDLLDYSDFIHNASDYAYVLDFLGIAFFSQFFSTFAEKISY